MQRLQRLLQLANQQRTLLLLKRLRKQLQILQQQKRPQRLPQQLLQVSLRLPQQKKGFGKRFGRASKFYLSKLREKVRQSHLPNLLLPQRPQKVLRGQSPSKFHPQRFQIPPHR